LLITTPSSPSYALPIPQPNLPQVYTHTRAHTHASGLKKEGDNSTPLHTCQENEKREGIKEEDKEENKEVKEEEEKEKGNDKLLHD
jgi:hypothetical protein